MGCRGWFIWMCCGGWFGGMCCSGYFSKCCVHGSFEKKGNFVVLHVGNGLRKLVGIFVEKIITLLEQLQNILS